MSARVALASATAWAVPMPDFDVTDGVQNLAPSDSHSSARTARGEAMRMTTTRIKKGMDSSNDAAAPRGQAQRTPTRRRARAPAHPDDRTFHHAVRRCAGGLQSAKSYSDFL